MLTRFNIRCRRVATVVPALCLAIGAAAKENPASARPDGGDVVRAYLTARQWIDAFDTPDPESPEAAVSIESARALCVMLRHRGRIVAEATDISGDGLMLRRALGRALGLLTNDAAIRDLPVELRPAVTESVTFELEVAGPLTPVIGDSFAEVASRIEPGMDGIAMRAHDRWVFVFPAQMRARNTCRNVVYLFPSLLAELDLEYAPLDDLRESDGLSVYRFETVHLTQRSADDSPFVTFRGGEVVPAGSVDREAVAGLADGIARHLLTRQWKGTIDGVRQPLGMLGMYRPTPDLYKPTGASPPGQAIASPREQALACLALMRYAATPGLDALTQGEAARFAGRILTDLAQYAPDFEPEPTSDPAACALTILAAMEVTKFRDPDVSVQSLVADARNIVRQSFDHAEGAFRPLRIADGRVVELSGEDKAMLAAATARMLLVEQGDDRPEPEGVRRLLDAAWASVADHEQPVLLPWIGWAEADYRDAVGAMPEVIRQRLTMLRKLLERSQVLPGRGTQPDLVGGYLLSGRAGAGVTSQGVRPAAWLSRGVTDPRGADDASLAAEVGRLLGFARFLIQLSVKEGDLWACQSPRRAVGGIRNALWDHDMAVAAQALPLVFACDLLEGLRRLDDLAEMRHSDGSG